MSKLIETIPLFPLSSVLLPGGRLPLQIFEPRYLDLISECLKQDSGFGVLWLREGAEVITEKETTHRFATAGCYARVVDWDQLSNGLLGVTIEGEKRFRLISSEQGADKRYRAEVEWLPVDPVIAIPDDADELKRLLFVLMEHPHVARLNIDSNINDVGRLSYVLAQLLPIDESIKFDLLVETAPLRRLELLIDLLDRMAE